MKCTGDYGSKNDSQSLKEIQDSQTVKQSVGDHFFSVLMAFI